MIDSVHRYVQAILESQDTDKTPERSQIVPIIKDRAWLKEIERNSKASGVKGSADYLHQELNEELFVFYAEDRPQSVRFLTADAVRAANVSQEELRNLAVTNLKALLPRIELSEIPPMLMLTAGGDYEASLLLFDSIWSSGQIKVEGEIVVAIPARDVLIITGSKNKAGLKKLRETAKKVASEANYTLTDKLFVYRDGKFVVFN